MEADAKQRSEIQAAEERARLAEKKAAIAAREIADLKRRNRLLEEQLADAKRQAAPFRKKKRTRAKGGAKAGGEEQTPRPRKPGRARGHAPSWKKPPDQEPDYVVEVPLCACPDCGGVDFEDPAMKPQTVVDIPPPRIIVTKYLIETARCTACGKRVQGRHPAQVSNATGSAGTQVGPRVAGLATELKHRFGASYRKTADLLRDALSFAVSPGGLVGIGKRMAQRLAPTLARPTHARYSPRRGGARR